MNASEDVGPYSVLTRRIVPLPLPSYHRIGVDLSEDGELAFQTFPGIYREEAIMLLRDFYMQENTNGLLPFGSLLPGKRTKLIVAPNPKLKNGRRKKLDFSKLDWPRYISEEKLLEAVPAVYGCDPHDEEAYKALEHPREASAEKELVEKLTDRNIVMQSN